jgi:predicted PurR-regulated permease PerM
MDFKNKATVTTDDVILLIKYVFVALVFYGIYTAIKMYSPLAVPIVLGIFLAIICVPLLHFIMDKWGWSQRQSTMLIIFSIFLVFVVPFFIAGWKLVNTSTEAVDLVVNADKRTRIQIYLQEAETDLLKKHPSLEKWRAKANETFRNTQSTILGGEDLGKYVKQISEKTITILKSTFSSLFVLIGYFLLALFAMYHFLCNWQIYGRGIKMILPLNDDLQDKIVVNARDAIRNVAYGMFLNGIFQGLPGIAVVLGYLMVFNPIDLPYYIIISLLIYVGSTFMAPVSTAAVFICAVVEFSSGGILGGCLLIGATFLISMADNYPKFIMGEKLQIGFVQTILSIACGIAYFGFLGFFLGILIAILLKGIVVFVFQSIEDYKKKDTVAEVAETVVLL